MACTYKIPVYSVVVFEELNFDTHSKIVNGEGYIDSPSVFQYINLIR